MTAWVSGQIKLPAKIDIKIRYRSKSIPAIINSEFKLIPSNLRIKFKAITPGQSAVFYKGEEMLGGGVIN